MRVFVTGATGFIGSHVVKSLLSDHCEVHALVLPGEDCWRICNAESRILFHEGDVLDVERTRSCLAEVKPEICLHLAWYAVPGKYPSALENVPFVAATLQMIQSASEVGCRRFVGVGTCCEYDFDTGYMREDSPTEPGSVYAACKLATCIASQELAKRVEISFAWPRIFYLYGPYEADNRLVSSVICRCLRGQKAQSTKGEQVRDFLHVEDVASAIVEIARSDVQGIVNVGSGQPITVREVVTTIGRLTGRSDLLALGDFPYRPTDPMFVCANNGKLRNQVGWEPRYNLELGLTHTVDWWQRFIAEGGTDCG